MFSSLKKPTLVMVAVPTYERIWAETVTCINNLHASGSYRFFTSYFRGGIIHRSRNQLAHTFLHHPTNPDYLLFVDSDMVFKQDALERLIDNRKDIVTGNAFSRKYPVKPVVGTFDQVRKGRVDVMLDYRKNELQPVDSCGMAFTLISRRGLEKVTAVHPRPFDPIFFPETDGELAEDSSFCWRAKEAGVQVWLDARVQIGHIGDVIFDERDFEAGLPQLREELAKHQPTH